MKTYLRFKIYALRCWFHDVCKYYFTSWRFAVSDLLLNMSYMFINPYFISRKYLEGRGQPRVSIYGETPLKSLHAILLEFDITNPRRVLELGCGRGKAIFWLANYFKADIVGIEQIPIFVYQANRIKSIVGIKNLEIYRADIFNFDMSSFDIIYCYGTCFADHEIKRLIKSFKHCSVKTKIITVSYPLSDYDSSFKTVKSCKVSFPWGETEVYCNVLKYP